jgi:spore germination protein KB
MYVATLGTSQLFKVKNLNLLAFPFGLITLLVSELIAKNYPQHIKRGLDYTVKYVHLPLQIIIPVIALAIAWFKNKNTQANE